ncbi:MAG: ferritin, partial [Phycisphaerae bacterium]
MSMLISRAMNAKLNGQVTNEFGASQKYLAMACGFEAMGLKILAERFRQQADEERAHALKILEYIQEVGGTVKVDGVPKPTGNFSDPMKILKGGLDSELKVT